MSEDVLPAVPPAAPPASPQRPPRDTEAESDCDKDAVLVPPVRPLDAGAGGDEASVGGSDTGLQQPQPQSHTRQRQQRPPSVSVDTSGQLSPVDVRGDLEASLGGGETDVLLQPHRSVNTSGDISLVPVVGDAERGAPALEPKPEPEPEPEPAGMPTVAPEFATRGTSRMARPSSGAQVQLDGARAAKQPAKRRFRVKRQTLSLWKVYLLHDRRRKIQLMRDFIFFYAPYMFLLLFIHSSSPAPSEYLKQNQALEDILFDEEFADVENHKKTFHDIMTHEELWSWCRHPLMGALFKPAVTGLCVAHITTEEPRGVNAIEGLCELPQPILGSNVLLGKVQFRQIRAAESDDCNRDPATELPFPRDEWREARGYKCYNYVHDDTAGQRGEDKETSFEEKGDFGPGLLSGAGPIYRSSSHSRNGKPHTKLKGSVQNVEALWGGSRDYGVDSYELQLSRNSTLAKTQIDEMEQHFVDEATRVLAISMNIYNFNTNQYTIVQLMFEIDDTGHIDKTIRMTTTKMLWSYFEHNGPYGTWNLKSMWWPIGAVILFSVWAGVVEVAELLDNISLVGPITGLQLYFRDMWNIFEVLSFVTFVFTFLSCLRFWDTCELCRTALQDAENEAVPGEGADFVDLKPLRDDQRDFQKNFATVIFLSLFKVFKYVAVSTRLSRLWMVLATAMWDVIAFAAVIFIILMAFAYFGVVLFGSFVQEFHNVPSALAALVRWSLGDYPYVDISRMKSAASVMSTVYFALFAFLVGLTSINLFVAIFVDWWEVRKELKKDEDDNWKHLRMEGLQILDVSRTFTRCFRRFTPEYGLQLYRDAEGLELFDIIPKVQGLRRQCMQYKEDHKENQTDGSRPPRLYVCFKREWQCIEAMSTAKTNENGYCSMWLNGYSDKMFSPPVDPPPGRIDWNGAEDDSAHDPLSHKEDLYLTLLDKKFDHNALATDLLTHLGRCRNGNGAHLVVGATDTSFASTMRLRKRRHGGKFVHTMVVNELSHDGRGHRPYRDRHYEVRDTFVEFELLVSDISDIKPLHQSSIFFRASQIGLDPLKDSKPNQRTVQGNHGHEHIGHLDSGDAGQLKLDALQANDNSASFKDRCCLACCPTSTAAHSKVAIQFQVSATCMIWTQVGLFALVDLPRLACASLWRKAIRLLRCCCPRTQSNCLSSDEHMSRSIKTFLYARTKELHARHAKYDTRSQRLEFEANCLELLPAREFYHALALHFGTHGHGDLLAQVVKSCSKGTLVLENVLDEINQQVLRLYPAAVDVQLDDDPTVVDGLLSSGHNSVAVWKKMKNYDPELDHFALDSKMADVAAHSCPSSQLLVQELKHKLESTVGELHAAYSEVPIAELTQLHDSATSADSRNNTEGAEDAAVMGARLVAVQLQLLLGKLQLSCPKLCTPSSDTQQQKQQQVLETSTQIGSIPIHGSYGERVSSAYLGLSSTFATPKGQRPSPWLGHDNLGKQKKGIHQGIIGEFGTGSATKHPAAAIPRYD